MDFNELTTISGAVVFIKRPAPLELASNRR